MEIFINEQYIYLDTELGPLFDIQHVTTKLHVADISLYDIPIFKTKYTNREGLYTLFMVSPTAQGQQFRQQIIRKIMEQKRTNTEIQNQIIDFKIMLDFAVFMGYTEEEAIHISNTVVRQTYGTTLHDLCKIDYVKLQDLALALHTTVTQVNRMLRELKLQYREKNSWHLTELGKQYGKKTTSGIIWMPNVFEKVKP